MAAIVMETITGSNGVIIPPKGYLPGVRKICDEFGIVMICDEVMAGWCRTGKMFAFENFDIKPDIVTFAKGVTCGYVQLGGVAVSSKIAEYFDDHLLSCGLTYSGHPLACAAVSTVFDLFEKNKIVEHVKEVTPYLEKKLDELVEKYDCFTARRGKGFMQGLVVAGRPVSEITSKALENGLLVISAGSDVLRLVPPLVITEKDIDEMIEKLEKSL